MAEVSYLDEDRLPTTEVVTFVALFVTALVTAQLIASKILTVDLPVLAMTVTFPAGTFAYAVTFFASDCMSELYGKKFARRVVNVAFFMNFVMLALVWIAIEWQAAPFSIDPQQFEVVLGAGTNIVAGSLLAYIISQNFDVSAFHWIREQTGDEYLWVRNLGSTSMSQLIDTTVFTVVAFFVAPTVLGIGNPLAFGAIVSTVIGQFIVKAIIAVIDTPLVYAATGYIKRKRA